MAGEICLSIIGGLKIPDIDFRKQIKTFLKQSKF